jgi:hypothetical protein
MKNCGIMDALKNAVEDKKEGAAREVGEEWGGKDVCVVWCVSGG